MLRSIKHERRMGAMNSARRFRSRSRRLCVLACFASIAAAISAGILRGRAQELFPLPAFDPPKSTSAKMPAPGQQQNPPAGSAPADQHTEGGKQKIANECASLLKMATDLKAEVDKTTKDTLSVTVVRKASEIEQLAHKVRTGTGN
jgi:hypothetical protein